MFLTSAECRTLAEQKLAEASHDEQRRGRLIAAAEGWLFLAGQLSRLEKNSSEKSAGRSRPKQSPPERFYPDAPHSQHDENRPHEAGSRHRSSRSPDSLKFKNPTAPAGKRVAEANRDR
jgi:hypothetical protein